MMPSSRPIIATTNNMESTRVVTRDTSKAVVILDTSRVVVILGTIRPVHALTLCSHAVSKRQ